MKLKANHHIKAGKEPIAPDEVFEIDDADGGILVKCGAATLSGEPRSDDSSFPASDPEHAHPDGGTTEPSMISDFADQEDPKKFLDSFKLDELKELGKEYDIEGGNKPDVINQIIEAQEKSEGE